MKNELIKELRGLTQAGMKDCQDALIEANWDLQRAVDIVKVKGLNVVSGRAGNIATEGMVAVSNNSGPATISALLECNSQTDFVANSELFKKFVYDTVDCILDHASLGKEFTVDKVEAARQELVSTIKENVVVRRWWVEEALDSKARVFTYIHPNAKIGVLLTLMASTEEMAKDPLFTNLGNDLAMQVAAMGPLAVSADKLDPIEVERQKAIFETQLKELKKPAASWSKILEGKFNKWYSEVCLLNQESIIVPKTLVSKVIENLSPKLGKITVVNFVRCMVGEGLQKSQSVNFADEVAKLV